MIKYMFNYKDIMIEKWKMWKISALEYRCMIKPCLILFTVYTLGISAILRANFNYRDDLRRVGNGISGWENHGRYLSNFLSVFIHADIYLADVSPLPQLIAAFLMAISAGIIWYMVSKEKVFSIWDIAALVPLGLSPYFLQCFSYKYDTPYMALSVLVSVVPLLFYSCGYPTYFLASGIGALVMCLTYQATSGIFPMFVTLLCLKKWNNNEKVQETLKFAGCSVGGYLLGMLLFKVFFMPQRNDYVVTSLPSIRNIIPVTIYNFAKYIYHLLTDFKTEWLFLILFLCIGFVFVMTWDTIRKWYVSLILSVITLFMLFTLCFGVYPVLNKPLFQPRGMCGFGGFLTFLGIAISTEKKVYLPKIVCFLLAWCFFSFSFTYGNALKEQEDYENFRYEALINDLNDLDIMMTSERKKVQVDGSMGYSPVVRHMSKDYKMLRRLVPKEFQQWWRFYHYYALKNVRKNWPKTSGVDFKNDDLPLLKDTMYHTIYGEGNCVLVEWR